MAHLESDRGAGPPESVHPLPAAELRLSGEIRAGGEGRAEGSARPRRPRASAWASAGIGLLLLLLWELGGRTGLIQALLFPAPSQIARAAFEMTASGILPRHLAITLIRMCLALVLGGVPGLLLGLAMGWLPFLRILLDPFVAALHPVPKIALLPLVMVFLGVGDASLIAVIALGAFFPMLINTMTGVWQINPIHFEVARNYGASRGQIFRRVVWPGSIPLVLAGLRLALNATLLLTVAAEMFTPRTGLGAMIWFGWQTMLTEEIYVSLLVITVLGILFSASIDRISRRWVPWEPSRTS